MTPEQKAELRRQCALEAEQHHPFRSDDKVHREHMIMRRYVQCDTLYAERLRVQPLIDAVGDTIGLLKSIPRGDNYDQIDTQQAELIAALTAYQNTER